MTVLALSLGDSAALAQHHPFAVGPREAAGSSGGLWGWIAGQQLHFDKLLRSAVAAALLSPAAFWGLAGICFVYGAVHAAGPGHGKAVIAAYVIANENLLRRATAMTFAAALLQAGVAIAIVGVGFLALRATASEMTTASQWVEFASYAIIVAFGAALVWRKGFALLKSRQNLSQTVNENILEKSSRFVCEATEPDFREICPDCGQSHAPDPQKIAGGTWKDMAAAVVSAGARPCSGAILVLVFTFAQGAYWIGIGSTVAMALGVALTTSALAALSVFAKKWATRRLEDSREAFAFRIGEFVAAAFVLALGLVLCVSALLNGGLGV